MNKSRPMIAYFSMEVGIEARVPTYSGGLGILAGDTVRSAADLDFKPRGTRAVVGIAAVRDASCG